MESKKGVSLGNLECFKKFIVDKAICALMLDDDKRPEEIFFDTNSETTDTAMKMYNSSTVNCQDVELVVTALHQMECPFGNNKQICCYCSLTAFQAQIVFRIRLGLSNHAQFCMSDGSAMHCERIGSEYYIPALGYEIERDSRYLNPKVLSKFMLIGGLKDGDIYLEGNFSRIDSINFLANITLSEVKRNIREKWNKKKRLEYIQKEIDEFTRKQEELIALKKKLEE